MMLNFIKIIADCQGITRLKTKWHKINCWDNFIFFLLPFSSFLKIFIKFLGWNSYSFQKVTLGLLFLKSFENLAFKKSPASFCLMTYKHAAGYPHEYLGTTNSITDSLFTYWYGTEHIISVIILLNFKSWLFCHEKKLWKIHWILIVTLKWIINYMGLKKST